MRNKFTASLLLMVIVLLGIAPTAMADDECGCWTPGTVLCISETTGEEYFRDEEIIYTWLYHDISTTCDCIDGIWKCTVEYYCTHEWECGGMTDTTCTEQEDRGSC